MKNYILLLLLATFGMQAQTLQNPTYGKLKLKNNQTSTTATKVNVQETDGTINTKPLSELANYLEFASAINLPVTGEQGKLYLTKDNNRLYRFNGTIYQELTTDISGKEDIANKQNSLAVDGTNTKYPTVTAVNAGLSTKVTTTGTTGNLQIIVGTNQLGNSALTDNGTSVKSSLPLTVAGAITGTTIIKSGATAANILLAGGTDITQLSLPVSTATQTALNLKANLASPALTGTPTAPTATAGTNTNQIATTAFVTGAISTADSGNVKLTGAQTITGTKTFTGQIVSRGIFNAYSNTSPFTSSTTDDIISRNSSINTGSAAIEFNAGGYTTGTYRVGVDGTDRVFKIGDNDNVYFKYQKSNGALTLESTGGVTAPKFIKSSAPTTNILLAGGGDIAQNTAFNKNFGTTAGTVVEGGTLGSNAYTSTAYLPLTGGIVNGSLTVQNSNYTTFSVKGTNTGNNGGGLIRFENQDTLFGEIAVETESAGNGVIYLRSLTNGSITQKASIASSGAATFSSTVTATSYTATSLPVFENNAAASSLAVGQFYRTSIGVLMVKF